MSIKHQIEINQLTARVDTLERIVNKLNDEPRMIACEPDPDHKPRKKPGPKPGFKRAKIEGA